MRYLTLKTGLSIDQFIEHLNITGYSESTIISYTGNIRNFKRYLEKAGIRYLNEVTSKVIDAYLQKVMEEPISRESKALKIRSVKRLFEYLVNNQKLLINPAEGVVEISRRKVRIGPTLTIEEIRLLFAQPDLQTDIGIRDRAIMEVMYATAIRTGELLHLLVSDADLKEGLLTVRFGKGRTQRVTPLGKNGVRYLKVYFEKVRQYGAKDKEEALFLDRFGKGITRVNLHAILRKHKTSAKIAKSVSPHMFRRTCATHLLQQGADIRYIQKLLGHKHLATTQRYTQVMVVDVKAIHERTHPKL